MKRILLLMLLVPVMAAAQKTHTVTAKETLFSIGRLYNIHPRELAQYNNIPFDQGLTVGQVLKIPASGTPMPPTAAATPAPAKEVKAVTVPVYHTVEAKEGLYGISKKYNTTIDDIKKWNNLSSDALSLGTKLIVGYKTENAVVANAAVEKEKEKVKELPKAEPPAPKKDVPAAVTAVAKETKPVIKEQEQQVKNEPVAAVKPNNKPITPEETHAAKNFNGGYFKSLYNDQKGKDVNENGTAVIFKSTSGWDDGKYYCLHNTAEPGTVIKITSPATGKSIYAKVLDMMPDIKQNNGVLVRLSNAAAAELGLEENKFDCTLSYSK